MVLKRPRTWAMQTKMICPRLQPVWQEIFYEPCSSSISGVPAKAAQKLCLGVSPAVKKPWRQPLSIIPTFLICRLNECLDTVWSARAIPSASLRTSLISVRAPWPIVATLPQLLPGVITLYSSQPQEPRDNRQTLQIPFDCAA